MRMPDEKALGGKVNLADNPVIPLVVDLIDSAYEQVSIMGGARCGKSFATECYVGREITTGERRQVLEGWPNDDMIRKYVFGDFKAMTKASPIFKDILSDDYDDKKAGSYKQKRYKNGANHIQANMQSSNDMSGVDAGVVIVHEWDRIPQTTANNGSTAGQIMARTQAQWRPKIIFESTPTIENGPIHSYFLAGTQHVPHFFFTCCEEWLPIWFEDKSEEGGKAGVQWEVDHLGELVKDSERFVCKSCGQMHTDAEIKKIIHAKGEHSVKLVATYPERVLASVHAGWLLFTPFSSLSKIVSKFLEATKQGQDALAAFYNLTCGLPYTIPGTKLDAGELIGRIEDRQKLIVPRGCVMVTSGVDVQLLYLAVQIIAWSENEKKHVLYYGRIDGDTSTSAPWDKLFTFLDKELETEYSGNGFHVTMPIEAVCVDTGGANTQYYYDRLRNKRPKYIAIKGSSQFHAPLFKRPRLQDINYADGKTIEKGIELNEIGVSQAKVYLYGQLANATKPEDRGYTSFGSFLEPAYFKELTSEKLVATPNPKTGKNKYHFDKISNRNEALDTFVYNLAAYRITAGMADEYLDYQHRLKMLTSYQRLDGTQVESKQHGTKAPEPKKKEEKRIQCRILKNNLFVASEGKRFKAGDVVDLPFRDYLEYAKHNTVAPIDSGAEVQKALMEHSVQQAIDEALAKQRQEQYNNAPKTSNSFFTV